MGKFLCACGDVIRISGAIPNPDEWQILSSVELEEMTPNSPLPREGRPLFDGVSIPAGPLYEKMRYAYICRTCGGLWIFWSGFGSGPTFYPKAETLKW